MYGIRATPKPGGPGYSRDAKETRHASAPDFNRPRPRPGVCRDGPCAEPRADSHGPHEASVFSADDLAAALAKLPTDRPSAAARVFTLAPYNVNVEQRQPRPQGASLHDAQAEFFYVIDGAATLLTGGTLTAPTRTGANVAGTGIEGGVRQAFRKGDFLLVPAGVPHQFVDIQAPVRLLQLYLPEPGK